MRRVVSNIIKKAAAERNSRLWLSFCLAMILSLSAVSTSFAAGGDLLWGPNIYNWWCEDHRATTSVMDSNGNTIVTGKRVDGNGSHFWTMKYDYNGGLPWAAESFWHTGQLDEAYATAVDGNNDVIVTGRIRNALNNTYDILTIKYRGSDGGVIWQHIFNGTANRDDIGRAIAVDRLNNVYVGGTVTDSDGNTAYTILKYGSNGPRPDDTPLWQVTSKFYTTTNMLQSLAVVADGIAATGWSSDGSQTHIYTAKFDLSGQPLWNKDYSSASSAVAKIKMDATGNVIVSGTADSSDIYTIKYDKTNGNTIWAANSSTDGIIGTLSDLLLDSAGNIYITATTSDNEIYTARYNATDGNSFEWDVLQYGSDNMSARGIVVDEPGNGVYITGLDRSDNSIVTAKYRLDMGSSAPVWASNKPNPNDFDINSVAVTGIGVTPFGNVVVSGSLSSPATANPCDPANKIGKYFVISYDSGLLPAPGVQATVTSATTLDLTFSGINSAESIKIERRQGATGTYTEIASLASPVTSPYTDSLGLTTDTDYYYRIRSYSAALGYSYYSAAVHVVTMTTPRTLIPVAAGSRFLSNNPDNLSDSVNSIAVGPDNNPVVTGVRAILGGFSDYYTVKLNRGTMAEIWSDLQPATNDQDNFSANRVVVDSSNNAIVSGNASLLNPPAPGKIASAFTLKYPAAGPGTAGQWSKQYNFPFANNSGAATAIDIATDAAGNTVMISGGSGTTANAAFTVVKYNSAGTQLWSTLFDQTGSNITPRAVAISPDGSVYVTGTAVTAVPDSGSSFFTARYNGVDGTLVWSETYQPGSCWGSVAYAFGKGNAITVDGRGDVYITGAFENNLLDSANSNRNWRTIKYSGASMTPQRLWETEGNYGLNLDNINEAVAIKIDPSDGTIVVAGNEPSAAGHQILIRKYHPDSGATLWVSGTDWYETDVRAAAMTVDNNGMIYVAGHHSDGSGIVSVIYDSEGNYRNGSSYSSGFNNDRATSIAVNALGEAFIAGYAGTATGTSFAVLKQVNNLQNAIQITATPQYDSRIDLNWSLSSGTPTGFLIERTTGPASSGSVWTTLATASDSTTSYTDDQGLINNSFYCYRVAALDGSTTISRASVCSLTGTLYLPTGLKATTIDNTSIKLDWNDKPGNEDGYKVERKQGSGAYAVIATLAPNTQTYTDSGLTPNTPYQYRVKVFKSGYSDLYLSNSVTALPFNPSSQTIYHFNNVDYGDSEAQSIAIGPDNNPAASGVNNNNLDGSQAIYTLKLDHVSVNPLWNDFIGGSSWDGRKQVVVDVNNNVIVAGNVTDPDSGNPSINVVKYPAGGLPQLWSGRYPLNPVFGNSLEIRASAIDSAGNVAVLGKSWGADHDYMHLLKYRPDGTLAWVAEQLPMQGSLNFNSGGVAFAPDGSVYVTGDHNTDESGEWRDLLLTAKFDGDSGALVWHDRYIPSGSKDADARVITVDTAGDVYVGAEIRPVNGNWTSYTIKYSGSSTTATRLWEHPIDGGVDSVYSIKVDPRDGTVVAAGKMIARSNYGSEERDMYIIKYKFDGSISWQKTFPMPGYDTNNVYMTLDPYGNIYVTAEANDNTSSVPISAFYDPNGNLLSSSVVSQPSLCGWWPDGRGEARPRAIAVNALGEAFIAGDMRDDNCTERFMVFKQAVNLSGNSSIKVPTPFAAFPTAPGSYGINLSWGVNTPGANTRIWRTSWPISDSSDWGTPIGTYASDTTSYTDNATTIHTNYCYRIEAFSGADTSPSLITCSTTNNINAPATLTTAVLDSTTIKLDWTDNSNNEEGFRIERKLATGGAFSLLATLGPNTTTYTDSGLISGNGYYYRVTAYTTAGGDSSASNEVLTWLYPSPAGSYRYPGTGGFSDYATAISVDQNGYPIITGYSMFAADETLNQFLTIRLNRSDLTESWKKLDATQGTGGATSLAVDSANHPVVSGSINGSAMLAKYGEAPGNLLWSGVNTFGFTDVRSRAVATSSVDDSIAIVGNGKNGSGNDDILIALYDAAGVKIREHEIDVAAGADIAAAVAFDALGDIYVTGYTEYDPANYPGKYSVFTAMLDKFGYLVWYNSYRPSEHDADGNLVFESDDSRGNALAIDSNGDVHVTGYAVNSAGDKDFFTIKFAGIQLDPLILWEKYHDGAGHKDDEAVGVKVDPVDGSIVVAGTTVKTNGVARDITVVRYNADGDTVWAKNLARKGMDDTTAALAVDPSGNIYVAGNTTNGNMDIISLVYDYQGKIVAGNSFNGPDNRDDKASSIAVNPLGEAFIAGYSTAADGNANFVVLKLQNNSIKAPGYFSGHPLSSSAIDLQWVISSPGASFNIERTAGPVSAASVWTPIATGLTPLTTGYADSTGLTSNTGYCYRIEASNGGLNSRKIVTCTGTAPLTPVLNPLTALSHTETVLGWTNIPGNNGYRVERKLEGGSWIQVGGNLAANTTSYHDDSIISGTVYSYRVMTIGISGASTPSNVQLLPALNVPTIVSQTQINLSWPAVSGISKYIIERSLGGAWTQVATPGVGTTAYSDTGLVWGTTYNYRLKVDTSSCASAIRTATTSGETGVTDTLAGVQTATASAMDSNGNVIITGYQNKSDANSDDYWTVKFDANGNILWRTPFNFANGSDQALSVAVDGNNDVIVTGRVWNGVNKDIHTMKFNGISGAEIWRQTFNGAANGKDTGVAVSVGSDNNIYVAGISQNGAGNDDYVILKYAPGGGAPAWQAVYDGTGNANDLVTSLAVGTDGVAVTGQSWNGTSFDMTTVKYDLDGVYKWEVRTTSSGVAQGEKVKFDALNNVIATGYVTNGAKRDIYTAKYAAANGAILWQKSHIGDDDDEPSALALDAAGDVYVTGYTMTLQGAEDFYTVRYRGDNGDIVWQKTFDSDGETDISVDMTVTEGDGVYVTGYTVKDNNYDIQTIKYKQDNGNQLWQFSFNGPANGNDRPVGIGLTPSGAALVAGWSASGGTDVNYLVLRYEAVPLNPPTGLTASAVSNTSVQLDWSDNSANEDGFRIERKVGASGTYSEITSLGSNSTSHTDTGLTPNTHYYYRIIAFDASNDSHVSNEAHALTVVVNIIPPAWSYLYNSPDNGRDYATAIAVGPDNNPVVTGASISLAGGLDYLTIKLDRTNNSELWRDIYDDPNYETDVAKGIVVDLDNNAIISGFSTRFYAPAAGNISSIFTIKYPSAGPPKMWEAQYNGPGAIDDLATAIATTIDATNNVVVIGYGKNAAFNDDIYVVKYNADGSQAWAAVPFDGAGGNDFPTAVAFAPDGSLFVTGYSETAAASGKYNFFTAKYRGSDGRRLWNDIYSVETGGNNRGNALAVDANGNVYVTGSATNAEGDKDIYTIKYNGTGNTVQRLWERSFDGSGFDDDEGVGVKVDPIDGGIVVAGSTVTKPGDHDVTVIKYTPSGDLVWQQTLQRPDNDDLAVAMTLDNSGYAYIAANTSNASNGGTVDIMSLIYDYDGNLQGATIFNGAGDSYDEASSIAVNAMGEAFIAGYATNAAGNDDYVVVKQVNNYIHLPSPFAVTHKESAGLNLEWTPNSPNTTFKIWRKVGPISSADAWTLINSPGVGSDAYWDAGIIPNTTYCYRIQAVDVVDINLTSRINVTCTTTTLAPPALSLTADNPIAITINWSNVPGNTGYTLERSTDNSDWGQLSIPLVADTITYTDSAVDSLTTAYYYRVRVINGNGPSEPCPVQAKPSFAAAVTSALTINTSWVPVSGATGYIIERSPNNTSSWVTAATPAPGDTSYLDNVLSNTTYYYRFSATTASATFGPSYVWTAQTPLMAPNFISATPVTSVQITLAWNDPNYVAENTGYPVRYELCDKVNHPACDDPNVSASHWTTPTDVTADAQSTTKTISGLQPNTCYRFMVSATNSHNGSDPSIARKACTPFGGPPSLTPTATSSTVIHLDWPDVPGETGYDVYQDGVKLTATPLPADTIAYDVSTGLTPGTKYSFFIRAYDNIGGSADSPAVIGITLHPAPSLLTVQGINQTGIKICWTPEAGATTYELYPRYLGYPNNPEYGDADWPWYGGLPSTTITPPFPADNCYTQAVTQWLRAGYSLKYYVRYSKPIQSDPGTTVWSENSNTLWGTPVPATPTITTAGQSSTVIRVSWGDGYGETEYNVQSFPKPAGTLCAAVDEATWSTGATVQAGQNATFMDITISAGVPYCFRVNAYTSKAISPSPWSVPAYNANLLPPILNALSDLKESEITLTWNSVPSAEGYRVEWTTDYNIAHSIPWTALPDLGTVTTFTDTGLKSDTVYYYRVRTLLAPDESGPSNTETARTIAVPVPTWDTPALSEIAAASIKLCWNDELPGYNGYKVERSLDNANPTTAWGEVANLDAGSGSGVMCHTDPGLAAGTLYYYRVSRKNSQGSYSLATSVESTTTLPAGPSVTLKTVSESSIDLTWQVMLSATNYKLWRSTDPGGPWTPLPDHVIGYSLLYCGYDATATASCETLVPIYTTYTDSGLAASTHYYYQVKATNANGDSATTSVDGSTFAALGGVNLTTVTAINSMKIKLDWTYDPDTCTPACNPPDGFEVWKQLWSGEWALIAKVGNENTYTDTANIEAQKAYIYKVRAYTLSDPATAFSNENGVVTPAFSAGDNTCNFRLIRNVPVLGVINAVPTGVSCGTGCSAYCSGAKVSLTAIPNTGAKFTGWSGACTGSSSSCILTMNGDTSVNGAFQ